MLRQEDFFTDTWKRMAKYLDQQLQALRVQNDGRHDEITTAAIRGQIAEVKRMLDLPKGNSGTDVDPQE